MHRFGTFVTFLKQNEDINNSGLVLLPFSAILNSHFYLSSHLPPNHRAIRLIVEASGPLPSGPTIQLMARINAASFPSSIDWALRPNSGWGTGSHERGMGVGVEEIGRGA